ncbi:MAG: hypothetical protein ABW157_09110 [Candidatus Thiodiazotropha sp. LLP2]
MEKLKVLLKSAWWFAVLIYVSIFLYSNFESVIAVTARLSYSDISIALICLLFGKLLLAYVMQLSLTRHSTFISNIRCFQIYNHSQLGKYIPGSIWQFIGRISLYKEAGISNVIIRDSILLETFWVLASSALIGLGFTLIFSQVALSDLISFLPNYPYSYIIAALILLYAALSITPWGRRFNSYLIKLRFTPLSAVTSAVIWIFLGISFWITLIPFSTDYIQPGYIIGLFALSYAIGFVVPFAPAGLGIREAVLVIGLLHILDKETSIVLASLNRILYISIEIFLAFAATLLKQHATQFNKT